MIVPLVLLLHFPPPWEPSKPTMMTARHKVTQDDLWDAFRSADVREDRDLRWELSWWNMAVLPLMCSVIPLRQQLLLLCPSLPDEMSRFDASTVPATVPTVLARRFLCPGLPRRLSNPTLAECDAHPEGNCCPNHNDPSSAFPQKSDQHDLLVPQSAYSLPCLRCLWHLE